MGRWTGTWLSGLAAAGGDATPGAPRGVRLGLPAAGPGSVASMGRRAAAFAVDALLSALVAGLFTGPRASSYADALPRNWSLLVFVVMYVFFTAAFGQTPGMRLLGLRVMRLDTQGPLGIGRAVARTALLVLLVPALLTDRDGRGLHDRASAAVVVAA